jgi:hypothetical protein
MIDKLNKLEKLSIIENSSLWFELREIRNHISHEYPDNPSATAKYLNQLYVAIPKLLSILDNIKARIDF